MPTFMVVTVETVNYASVVFVGVVVVAAVWYWVWGYENYAGPPLEGAQFDADSPSEGHNEGHTVNQDILKW